MKRTLCALLAALCLAACHQSQTQLEPASPVADTTYAPPPPAAAGDTYAPIWENNFQAVNKYGG